MHLDNSLEVALDLELPPLPEPYNNVINAKLIVDLSNPVQIHHLVEKLETTWPETEEADRVCFVAYGGLHNLTHALMLRIRRENRAPAIARLKSIPAYKDWQRRDSR